jgi:hypothetical protein
MLRQDDNHELHCHRLIGGGPERAVGFLEKDIQTPERKLTVNLPGYEGVVGVEVSFFAKTGPDVVPTVFESRGDNAIAPALLASVHVTVYLCYSHQVCSRLDNRHRLE